MTGLDDSPDQVQEPSITDPFPYASHQQSVMHGIEVGSQTTFDDPAPHLIRSIL